MGLNLARGFQNLFRKASQTMGPSKFLFGQFPDEFSRSRFMDPYEQHPVVFAVINVNAQKVASIPFKLYGSTAPNEAPIERSWTERAYALEKAQSLARLANDPRKSFKKRLKAVEQLKEIIGGAWFELFHRPNPNLKGRAQLWEITVTHLLLFGESFWILEGKNGALREREMPAEIWPVKPNRMKHHVNEQTKVIDYWTLEDGRGKEIRLETWQVVHFKTGIDLYRGLPPIRSMNLDLTTDYHAKAFNLSRFLNQGFVGGWISSKGTIEDEDRQRMRVEFEERQVGLGKNNRLLIIDGDSEYHPNEINNVDMQFLEGQKFTLQNVCSVFHTPKFIIEETEEENLALAQASRANWVTSTIIPILQLIEDTLLFSLFVPVTESREVGLFDLNEIPELEENVAEKMGALKDMLRSGITLRAANDKLNLGLTEDQLGPAADIAFVATDMVPLDSALMAPAEEDDISEDMQGDMNNSEDTEEPQGEEDSEADGQKSVKLGSTSESRERLWLQKDNSIIRPNEMRFRGKIERWLYEMRAAQLKRLEQVIGKKIDAKSADPEIDKHLKELISPDQIERILLDSEEWAEKGYKKLEKTYLRAMKDSSEDAADMVNMADFVFDGEDPLVKEILVSRRVQFSGISKDIQESIRRTLSKSLESNDSARQTADKVRAKFNEMTLGRALTISRTENASAQEGARQIVFDDAQVPYLRWISSRDKFVRDSHRIDGETVPRGTLFSNGLEFPLDPDHGGPEEKVNCRCLSVPVFER